MTVQYSLCRHCGEVFRRQVEPLDLDTLRCKCHSRHAEAVIAETLRLATERIAQSELKGEAA